jgi:hypothetical protein
VGVTSGVSNLSGNYVGVEFEMREKFIFLSFLSFFSSFFSLSIENKFNPSVLYENDLQSYRNLPSHQNPKDISSYPIPSPSKNQIHEGGAIGHNSIIGLALYNNFLSGFRRLVGSLRATGYNGQILLGVNPKLPKEEFEYLKRNNVTLYGVTTADCSASALNSHHEHGIIRGKCSEDIPDLKLEWGRFEMARRWLHECELCTGWSLLIDTRDIFFQADPVTSLEILL